MTEEDEKIEMRALTLEDCRNAMAEMEADGPRGFDPMTQMYLLGLQMGRQKQHRLDVEWLERYVLKERILSNPVVIMGMETWKAFKNREIGD